MGRVNAALKKVGISGEEREAFRQQAMSGDYDHLLRTVMGGSKCSSGHVSQGKTKGPEIAPGPFLLHGDHRSEVHGQWLSV